MSNQEKCNNCENFWLKYPKKRPYCLAYNDNEQITLYQCNDCGYYWEERLNNAHIITADEAYKHFSEYFRLKRK